MMKSRKKDIRLTDQERLTKLKKELDSFIEENIISNEIIKSYEEQIKMLQDKIKNV